MAKNRIFRVGVRSLLIGLMTLGLVLMLGEGSRFSANRSFASAQARVTPLQFKQTSLPNQIVGEPFGTSTIASTYMPPQETALVDPSNYDDRLQVDAYGNPVQNDLIVVIHETVGSASSAINQFQIPHPLDADQSSYHSLIRQDGTVVHLVPPEKRAFGAGNSVFVGANGSETVRINAALPPSVNNFAYHTSLESPADGRGNQRTHSGYTEAQYRSLAWVVAQTRVRGDRITTHRSVDRSGMRLDPRSFNPDRFFTFLRAYLPETSSSLQIEP
jgi:hypothetical protein